MLNGSDFECHSKSEHPNHSKTDLNGGHFESYVLVRFLNGWDHNYSYGPNHSKSEPSHYRTPKRSDFEWVRISDVRYSSPHCTVVWVFGPAFRSLRSGWGSKNWTSWNRIHLKTEEVGRILEGPRSYFLGPTYTDRVPSWRCYLLKIYYSHGKYFS